MNCLSIFAEPYALLHSRNLISIKIKRNITTILSNLVKPCDVFLISSELVNLDVRTAQQRGGRLNGTYFLYLCQTNNFSRESSILHFLHIHYPFIQRGGSVFPLYSFRQYNRIVLLFFVSKCANKRVYAKVVACPWN
jgi:hypothetical protein